MGARAKYKSRPGNIERGGEKHGPLSRVATAEGVEPPNRLLAITGFRNQLAKPLAIAAV